MKKILLLLIVCLPVFSTSAQTKPDGITGTWTLVLVDNLLPDGTRVHLYGDNPQGLLTLDAGGYYSLQIFSTDRSKFAANDKAQGTPEEYKRAMTGCNTHFGKFTVNTADHTITFQIERASYPNWEGVTQKRSFILANDELKYTVPAPTSGANAGATGEVVWKRLR
jgi:hypothetical protein